MFVCVFGLFSCVQRNFTSSISEEVHSIKMHRGCHNLPTKPDFSASLEWQIRVFEGKSGFEVKFL